MEYNITNAICKILWNNGFCIKRFLSITEDTKVVYGQINKTGEKYKFICYQCFDQLVIMYIHIGIDKSVKEFDRYYLPTFNFMPDREAGNIIIEQA